MFWLRRLLSHHFYILSELVPLAKGKTANEDQMYHWLYAIVRHGIMYRDIVGLNL